MKFLFLNKPLFLLSIFFYSVSLSNNLSAQENERKDLFELKSLKFLGNEYYASDYLADLIATRKTPSWISKALNTITGTLGSPPNYYDPVVFSEDLERLKKFYQENGFRDIKITANIKIDTAEKSVHLEMNIFEGHRSLISKIIYQNIDSIDTEVKNEILFNPYIKPDDGYSSELILKEIKRIIKILSNSGYPTSQIENKSVIVGKLSSTNNIIITIPIETGRKLLFGNSKIKFEEKKEQNIVEDIVLKQLDYKVGERYSIDKKIESERNLSRLGIFEYARIEAKFPGENDSSSLVPLNILLKPKDRYELAPEIFINSQDYAFNLGLGLNGIIRNIGGGAQSIVGAIRGRAQSLNQGNLEFSLQWIQPYFFSNRFTLNVTTSFGLDFRNEYKQNILQNKVSVTSKFYQYNFFNFGFIDWDLERAEVTFLVDTQNVTNPYLKDQFSRLAEPQFNSIIGITLQHDNTNDIFSPTSGNYLSVSIEEAGVIPKFLIKDREKLRYSQFYKLTLFGKLFAPISTDTLTVFASKLKFGFAKQYGEKQEDFPIPLTRKFFVGGSSSIRGWRSRELGSVIKPELGGKLVLEGNLEMRIHAFKKGSSLLFLDANKIWLVCFMDFGNIWNNFNDIHLSEIAVAGGLGLRYDAFFGPIRFDFGFRIYDPYSMGNKWIMNKKILSEIISKGQIHFGIGHAF